MLIVNAVLTIDSVQFFVQPCFVLINCLHVVLASDDCLFVIKTARTSKQQPNNRVDLFWLILYCRRWSSSLLFSFPPCRSVGEKRFLV